MIGSGVFGAVYRAHQAIVDREVAVKVILAESRKTGIKNPIISHRVYFS